MTDALDKAKEREQEFREAAITAALQTSPEPKQWIQDGRILCLECGCEIPQARLEVDPKAAYCVPCKSELED